MAQSPKSLSSGITTQPALSIGDNSFISPPPISNIPTVSKNSQIQPIESALLQTTNQVSDTLANISPQLGLKFHLLTNAETDPALWIAKANN